jgi:hypothetical protein
VYVAGVLQIALAFFGVAAPPDSAPHAPVQGTETGAAEVQPAEDAERARPEEDPTSDAAPGSAPGPVPVDGAKISHDLEPAPNAGGATDGSGVGSNAVSTPNEASQAGAQDDPGGFENLLAGDEEAASRPVRSARAPQDGVDRDEVLRRAYRKIYRPPNNPVRGMFTARLAGGFMGGNRVTGSGGRYGGLAVEGGVTWNHFGLYFGGLAASASVVFDNHDGRALAALGGAAGINLGRLAHVRRALVNFSAGYRATAMPLGPVFAGDPAPTTALLVPHGPELRLDTGFLLHDPRARRLRHSVGISIGHQVIVSTVGGNEPVFHASTLGMFYAFG